MLFDNLSLGRSANISDIETSPSQKSLETMSYESKELIQTNKK